MFFVFSPSAAGPPQKFTTPRRAHGKTSKETAAAALAYRLYKMQLPIVHVIKINASSSQHYWLCKNTPQKLPRINKTKQNKEENNLTLYSKITFLSIQGIVMASFWSNKAYTDVVLFSVNKLTFPRNYMLRRPRCRRLVRAYQRKLCCCTV